MSTDPNQVLHTRLAGDFTKSSFGNPSGNQVSRRKGRRPVKAVPDEEGCCQHKGAGAHIRFQQRQHIAVQCQATRVGRWQGVHPGQGHPEGGCQVARRVLTT